ncbi:hypothetical protein BDR07DRAFT_918316 [Suillus spraguei]|nr:hypothetical protein BDR07DRAFT_918316 [Suillus spraguei]
MIYRKINTNNDHILSSYTLSITFIGIDVLRVKFVLSKMLRFLPPLKASNASLFQSPKNRSGLDVNGSFQYLAAIMRKVVIASLWIWQVSYGCSESQVRPAKDPIL